MAIKIDAIDLKIIRTLQQDGRITNLQLANQIGLSPAPTLERVKKLEKAAIIGSYHARINEEALGITIKAFIQVSLARQKDNTIQSFASQIRQLDEVIECYQVTGSFDYQLKVMVKDITAFDKLISEKLGKIEEIGQLESYIIISTIKPFSLIPLKYD